MALPALLQALGAMGFFPSRAFVPAFVLAVLFRVGDEIRFLADSPILTRVADVPAWFTSDACIIILGILALAEILATKSPEVREFLEQIDVYVKPALAFLVYVGVLSTTDGEFVQDVIRQAGFEDYLPGLVMAVGVAWMAHSRHVLYDFLRDADPADDTGVQRIMSWIEDVWTTLGPFVLLLFPIVMLVLLAIAAALLVATRVWLQRREDKQQAPCPNCGRDMYQSALQCPHCSAANPSPHAIGFLGTAQKHSAPPPEQHALHLVEKGRCPACATRLQGRTAQPICPACGRAPFADPAFVTDYQRRLRNRVPEVLGIGFICSLFPVVGLIPGVLYYRFQLVGPFRRYLPRGRNILVRWGLRILVVLLIALQWIPVAGGFVVPALALLSYTVYRNAFAAQYAELAKPD